MQPACVRIDRMELTWYGRTCVRLRGKDAVVARRPVPLDRRADRPGHHRPRSSRSPTPTTRRRARPRAGSRGTAGRSCRRASSDAFVLDGPGEYEVRDVLVTGVRTYRDDAKGRDRGRQTAFVVELDGLHTIHLGDIGHLLTEEKLGDIGSVDVACVPVGGALTATAGRLSSSPSSIRGSSSRCRVCEDEPACDEALGTFFHEMGGAAGPPVARLAITPSSLPTETTTVLLEARGKA